MSQVKVAWVLFSVLLWTQFSQAEYYNQMPVKKKPICAVDVMVHSIPGKNRNNYGDSQTRQIEELVEKILYKKGYREELKQIECAPLAGIRYVNGKCYYKAQASYLTLSIGIGYQPTRSGHGVRYDLDPTHLYVQAYHYVFNTEARRTEYGYYLDQIVQLPKRQSREQYEAMLIEFAKKIPSCSSLVLQKIKVRKY